MSELSSEARRVARVAAADEIKRRAAAYRHRPIRNAAAGKVGTKGAMIRARIVANAERCVAIAAAMKAEAGVKDHALNGQFDGGIAWAGRAAILAPEGENRLQLSTLAHECGHVFLHADALGIALPNHVREYEAEAYAHQAFRHHGLQMPPRITAWGRQYVAGWVEDDRAAGIKIDPRAEAYAKGMWSPFAPLRKIPATWGQLTDEQLSMAAPLPEHTTPLRLDPKWVDTLTSVENYLRSRWVVIADRRASKVEAKLYRDAETTRSITYVAALAKGLACLAAAMGAKWYASALTGDLHHWLGTLLMMVVVLSWIGTDAIDKASQRRRRASRRRSIVRQLAADHAQMFETLRTAAEGTAAWYAAHDALQNSIAEAK